MLALPGGALGPHHTHRYEQPPRTQHGFCGGSLQRRVHPGRGTGPSPTHSLGLAMSSGSTVSAISTISNVASAAIVALGALWLTQQRSEAQDADPECPTCEGTGYTDCVCNRWSDGDVGCNSCNGTGKSVCPTCGGGGKGVPIYAKIVARDSRKL